MARDRLVNQPFHLFRVAVHPRTRLVALAGWGCGSRARYPMSRPQPSPSASQLPHACPMPDAPPRPPHSIRKTLIITLAGIHRRRSQARGQGAGGAARTPKPR
jgi:hypothetical protein